MCFVACGKVALVLDAVRLNCEQGLVNHFGTPDGGLGLV
jgi:hypothetical protein